MYKNGGNDLWVLIAQQLCHRQRIHPLQAFNARNISALQDTVNQQRCLVIPKGTAKHRTNVIARVRNQEALRRSSVRETVNHAVNLLARDRLHARDSLSKLLHFFRRKMLEYFRRLLFAKRHQQNRRVVQTFFIHETSSIQSQAPQAASPCTQVFRILATATGLALANTRASSSRSCSGVTSTTSSFLVGAGSAGRSGSSASSALS